MNIEIKKSIKPIKYDQAIKLLEQRLKDIDTNKKGELIWILEHEEVYTAGTSYKEEEILNKNINLIKTNRGGKITYHGPGQLICYFVIDLKKRQKNIRKFLTLIPIAAIFFVSLLSLIQMPIFLGSPNDLILYSDRLSIIVFSINVINFLISFSRRFKSIAK